MKTSQYLIIEAIFITSLCFLLNKDHDKTTDVICRKACSDWKHCTTCSIRHFLYLSSHFRTSRIDHNVLMKYASGVSGYDPADTVQSVFLRLLSMNVRRSLLFYVFPSLRLSLHPSLSVTRAHCIHFCAFKKSPRITNLAESELTGVTEDYKRKQNQDGPGDVFGFFFPL